MNGSTTTPCPARTGVPSAARPRTASAMVLVALLVLSAVPSAGQQPAGRRAPELTVTEAFEARSIPAYRGHHPDVYAHIDASQREHLANLQRWLRQPSVSAQNQGIAEMAAMLRDDLARLGCGEAQVVPTSGHPGVWAFCDEGAPRTLAVYMMYDVQPVEAAEWRSPPFAAEVVDHPLGRVLMARGATNQKGPQRAFLNALESIRAVKGKLPVNLMFLAEGEEELGSPHYPELIARFEGRLKGATGVFFPFNSQDPDGAAGMFLGVKGILYFELAAKGGAAGGPTRSEIHGSYKAITDSPTWRLVQALASLTSPDGNSITVPGYYDAIRAPNAEEQRLLNGLLPQWMTREPLTRRALGVERWIGGMTGKATQLELLFNTTLNIDGLWSGYTGPGTKTILPHIATAKVDSRLVPNQQPDAQLALIRKHLDAKGFTDITIHKLSGYPPAQSSVDAPLVRAAIGVFNKMGLTPSVAPRIAGSAPYYVFTERLGLPMVASGLGHGSGAHGPNEYLVVEPRPGSRVAGLAAIEKGYVDLVYALAESRR